MKVRYRFPLLSSREQEYLEMVLLEGLEIQTWYGITCSHLLGGEALVHLQ